MILLSELLDEDGEAAAQAKQMGLISKGWGRWADPRTGKVTHKTDGSRLVAVDPQQQEPSGGQEPDLDKVAQDLDKSKNTGNVAQDLDKKEPNFTRIPRLGPVGQETNKQRIDNFLDKVSTVKNKDKAAKLIHNKIQHTEKQWTGVFDTTPKDPMYKNYGEADFEDDLYNLERGYNKIVGKPYDAKDFADKGTAVAVRNTGNVGMGSAGDKDRAKLANKFLKKGTADAAKAKRLGDTRPHVVKNLSDKDLEKRMNKISDYMDDLKSDMRGATGSYKEKYEKATKDDREAFKIYHDEFEKRRKGKVGPKPGAEPDPSALNVKGDKANKLKRAQSLRQAWKQKGNAEAQATLARDFPKQYALDVVHQQGKDLTSDIQRGINGPEADNPQWRKDAAEQLKRHKERVAKIREMPDDTEFSDEEGMSNRRAMLDRLRGDGDDTVSGMSGKVPRIVRR